MIRRPPRSTPLYSSAASDVYKRQGEDVLTMSDHIPEELHVARSHPVGANGRPIRKDEIELSERGLYVESWMPERRSRRRPLLFIHGELTGSWIWERYLSYFA